MPGFWQYRPSSFKTSRFYSASQPGRSKTEWSVSDQRTRVRRLAMKRLGFADTTAEMSSNSRIRVLSECWKVYRVGDYMNVLTQLCE